MILRIALALTILLPLAATYADDTPDTFKLPSLSMPLAFPEPTQQNVPATNNDVSELQESRYSQKDPQPTPAPLDAMQVPLDVPTTIDILETTSPTTTEQ